MSGVSVVIPTFNRRRLLGMTLDALCSQSLDKSTYEVIVVDDGSSDGSETVVNKYRDRLDISYFFQEDRGFRVAAARNVGIYNAKYEITLFIDSGMLVSRDTLAIHMRCHHDESSLAVIGLSYGVQEYENGAQDVIAKKTCDDIDASLRELSCYSDTADCRSAYLESIDFDLSRMPAPWLIFWTGHVSVSTAALLSVGGFDEWFQRWGGEDVELGLRLHQKGCKFVVVPKALSIHYPHFKDAPKKMAESKINVAYIHSKHQLSETHKLLNRSWLEIVLFEEPLLST
jgi:glycosyltransferase involved in cell wall biosynthesis